MSNASDFIVDKGILKDYIGSGGTVVIPDDVRMISPCSLHHLIVSLTIPKSVTHIVADVFKYCYNLKELTILGEDVETSAFTFMGCDQLQKIIAPGVAWDTLRYAKLLLPAAIGFLENSKRYCNPVIIEEYTRYVLRQRKKILPQIFRIDSVAALEFYATMGKITAANYEKEYFLPAQQACAMQCVAFLINWQNLNILLEEREKERQKELDRDPFNVKDMRQTWSFEPSGNNTVTITGYKGEDTKVFIPPRIGKSQVRALSPAAFSTLKKRRQKKQLEVLENITEIIISDGVREIGTSAFTGCKNVRTIQIPESVERIGDRAFYNCAQLQSVTLPDCVKYIGQHMFEGCRALKSVKISSNVHSVDFQAFKWCEALQEIVIPESVRTIGEETFYGCVSLQKITISENTKLIGKTTFSKCQGVMICGKAGSYAETYAKENNIPFVAE